MAANLENWKSAMQTAIEDLTPTVDGSGVTAYAFIDDLIEERGQGGHRSLLWRMSSGFETISETPLEPEWRVPLWLFIHRNDRTYAAFATAVEDEIADIALEWQNLNALGTNVKEAILDRVEVEEDEPEPHSRAGGKVPRQEVARIRFEFRVLTGEA